MPREDAFVRAIHVRQELTQRLDRFHSRAFQRVKAIAMIHRRNLVEHMFTLVHFRSEIVAKSLGVIALGRGCFFSAWPCLVPVHIGVAGGLADGGRGGKESLCFFTIYRHVWISLGARGKARYHAAMTNDRITQLEETIAHLTRQVEELNEVVARQDTDLSKITHRVKMLMEREAQRESAGTGGVILGDERPPHY